MMNHSRHSGPQHYNHSNPWAPQQQHIRGNFNINRFMHPPHAVQRPNYTPDDIFASNVPDTKVKLENFPFNNSYQGCHQNNGAQFHGPQNHHNGPPYQGHPGRGRGHMRGHRGGHGFRGGHRGGFGGKPPNNQNQKKKEKVDKRDLPENNVYFCDICDRGFKTEDKYKEHVDGHTKCSFEDCPYIAAPKLVQLHMSLQHRSGLAKKVWNMESEEDVKKWREDRKRNFPTAENIARKRKEREEKIARGELLETKDFSKMRNARGRGRGRGRGGRNDRGRGRNKWRDHDRVRDGKGKMSGAGHIDDDDDDAPPEEVKIKRSKAPVKVEASSPTPPLDKSEIVIKSEPLTPQSSPQKSSGGGLALLASYGDSSSDEEFEEKPDVQANIIGQKKTDSHPPSDVPEPSSQSPTKKRNALPNPFAPVSTSPSSPATSSSASPHQPTAHMSHVGVPPCVPKSRHMDNLHTPQSSDLRNAVSEEDASVNDIVKKRNLNNNGTLVRSSAELEDFHSHDDAKTRTISDKSSTIHSPRTTEKASSSEKKNQRSPNAGGKRERSRDTSGGPLSKKIKRPGLPVMKKYTLLEKLLAPDIRRERNKILQCVHYIVKNKFFENHSGVNRDADPEMFTDTVAVFSPQVKTKCNM